MMPKKKLNREEWLNTLRQAVSPLFAASEFPLPDNIRVSCGFPKGGRKAVGQCWSTEASEDGTYEIFISPVLADTAIVAATLVHELCHAAAGTEAKHKGEFKRCAEAMGLEGKMTATHAGENLAIHLSSLVPGPYPHAELTLKTRAKEGTRLIKVQCPQCDYTVRTTRKWLEVGVPTCPCGTEMGES
jgi:hypothetical protein